MVSDPRRLIDGDSPLAAALLRAGQLEEPAPALVERLLGSAALGLASGVVLSPGVAASAPAASGAGSAGAGSAGAAAAGASSAAGTTASAAAGVATGAGGLAPGAGALSATSLAGAAASGTGVATGAAASGAAAGAIAKSGLAGAALVKWIAAGAIGVATATGGPSVLHWVNPPARSAVAPAPAPEALPREALPRTALPRTALPRAAAAQAARGPEMTSSGSDATTGATQSTPVARRSAGRRPASVTPATPAAAPVPPSPAAATPAPPVHAAGDSGALGVELRAVDRARDALQRGDASGALRALASYERDAPERQLALEVARLRMEAHAALGEHAEARALAAEILAQRPSPQHARRAREVLGGAPAER